MPFSNPWTFVFAKMNTTLRKVIFLGLFAFLLAAAGSWWLPILDRDEPRFAEASREMRERDEWVIPYFNNNYRFDKPPLVYWCQRAVAGLIGESDVSVRVPSMLAAALTAVIIFGFGRRWKGETTGFWAAVVFTLSLQTLIHSKLALADMLMICFSTLAMWAGWELLQSNNKPTFHGRWWWIFYGSLALAFLAKGPVGWIAIGMVLWSSKSMGKRWANDRMCWGYGLLLMFFIIGLWGIPALIKTQGEFFKIGIGRHVVARSLQTMEGHGGAGWFTYLASLPFYFLTFFFSFFPWCLWVPKLLMAWRKRSDPLWSEEYLGRGIMLIFVIFTLVKTKLPHYTLPAFPCLALLFVSEWQQCKWSLQALRFGSVFMVGFALVISLVVAPLVRPYFPTIRLIELAAPYLTAETEFCSSDYQEPSLAWYFRRYTTKYHESLSSPEVVKFMEKPGARLAILPTRDAAELLPTPPTTWLIHRVEGWNVVRGRKMDITMWIKP